MTIFVPHLAEALATTLATKAKPTNLSTQFISVPSQLGWWSTSNPSPHFWQIINLVESENRCHNGGGNICAEF
ncbi:hypothetical protein HCG51_10020 [Tolypothrix sp. PCC 7910]|uniref:hypothetical protein n=1 Tax=Tolypothrix sp. PCC 7910 TaxID=2099387 RepID=UPI0014279F5B|nr:hypothetical protein [Tolypothrix sp. PCC 7910]QIR37041.1 hypothetical protein HCG51_10020 [Tolypothrix sp. PCC 7910]